MRAERLFFSTQKGVAEMGDIEIASSKNSVTLGTPANSLALEPSANSVRLVYIEYYFLHPAHVGEVLREV